MSKEKAKTFAQGMVFVTLIAVLFIGSTVTAKVYTDKWEAEQDKANYSGIRLGDIEIINVREHIDSHYEISYEFNVVNDKGTIVSDEIPGVVGVELNLTEKQILDAVKADAEREFNPIADKFNEFIYDPEHHELEDNYYNSKEKKWMKK